MLIIGKKRVNKSVYENEIKHNLLQNLDDKYFILFGRLFIYLFI